MKKFFAIFLTVIIVLCFVVSVYLHAENAELREQGSLKVFSSRAYFAALSEISFPSFELYFNFDSVDSSVTYTYAEFTAMVKSEPLWWFFSNAKYVIPLIADRAVSGNFSGQGFRFHGIDYNAIQPLNGQSYSSRDDVIFGVESVPGTFLERVESFFKYVGDCIKTVGKFIQAFLPFNSEYYVTTTVSSSFTVDASNYVGVSVLSGNYVFLRSNPYLKYSYDDTNTHSIVWLDSSGNVLDYGPLFDGDSSLYSTARAIYDRFYNVVKITLYESGETIE